ncbi:serine/threonine-protein kinase PCRK1-like isoform X1 [Zingiber officinale]|uniref:serine/threonine-protein kinase PCRK1-like isoform X1 n=1 Tax=Zingiber officinale TaxID=94328 RepID=UPI001C4B6025|nr:serine/threonine-protein kinase PCRK1-like isoform X1 [Zingiber officinale]
MKCFHSHGDEGAGGVFDDGGSRASRFSWIRSFSTASASSLLGFEPRPTGSEHDPAWELPRLAVWPPEGLRSFSFSELKAATRGFNRSLLLGEGGFGSVYKGDLTITGDHGVAETMEVAVKQLNRHGLQGHNEWVTEVKFLGVVKHPNLVKLVGYCAEDDERGIQRLLVYELMHNKSLEFHLLSRVSTALSWVLRLKIAQDAARGLAFLHEEMDFQLIFRDFKTSNILLDDDFNAKLSDFGFARHGPAEGVGHVLTSVVGTVGYAAPEYVQTGKLTTKSDVWSFGVFLYELLTGRKSVDWNLPKSEQRLLEWVKPFATNPRKLQAIIDPRLDGNYCSKSVLMVVALANRCLKKQPKSRPRMSEVVERLDQIIKMCTSQTTNAILSPSLSPSPSPSPSSGDAISDRTKWPEDKGSRTQSIEFKHITRPLAKMTKAWG